MEMTDKQLDLVGHTLGVNSYHARLSNRKKDKYLPDEFYRNYFCAGTEKHGDFDNLISLESAGLMKRWTQYHQLYFCVTDKGIELFRKLFKEQITDTYIPLSKSKEKYQEFLHADTGLTFDQYFGIWIPKVQYYYNVPPYERVNMDHYSIDNQNKLRRYISTKYNEVKGEFKLTSTEAKKSYKLALSAYKKLNKYGYYKN